jgi:hypothetical protein
MFKNVRRLKIVSIEFNQIEELGKSNLANLINLEELYL